MFEKFATKRFVLSVLIIGIGTAGLWSGHLDGEWWCVAVLGALAGHHGEDLIRAFRGAPDKT